MLTIYKESFLFIFLSNFQKVSHEIDNYVTKAEMLSLKGDITDQKDLIVEELNKVRQQFLSQINDIKQILQDSVQFFRAYEKVKLFKNFLKDFSKHVISKSRD